MTRSQILASLACSHNGASRSCNALVKLLGQYPLSLNREPRFVMGMKPVPPTTSVARMTEERQELEALVGPRKVEARMRDRARHEGYSNWTAQLLTRELLDIHEQHNGRAMTGRSHDCKRNGTAALFASLNMAAREVAGRH